MLAQHEQLYPGISDKGRFNQLRISSFRQGHWLVSSDRFGLLFFNSSNQVHRKILEHMKLYGRFDEFLSGPTWNAK